MAAWQNLTDEELMDQLRLGDGQAYTEIFFRYNRLLVAHAYRLLADRDMSRDVVQDVLLSLWQKREIIRLTGPLSGYLYRATRNRIFDQIAHKQIVDRYVDAAMHFLERGTAPSDEQLIEKELAALIEREVRLLPENMRMAFILRKQQELDYAEIARQLGISEAAAKQQVYNAVKQLRLKISRALMLMLF